MHQREGIHHHLEDVVGIRTVILHPMLEQRAQQIGVLGEEVEIGLGEPIELPHRVFGRNPAEPHRQRLDRLPIDRQDHPVEVAELVIDAADGAAGGLGHVSNLQ